MMTVQATDTAVSIWITREEPPTGAGLRLLVRQALAERGLAPWEEMEAECFAAGEDALVIARPVRGRRPAFYFPDLEALLAGALACADGPSALYAVQEGYVLAVDRQAAGPGLYEFGRADSVSAAWEIHAAEQGRALINRDAIGTLRRYFGRPGGQL